MPTTLDTVEELNTADDAPPQIGDRVRILDAEAHHPERDERIGELIRLDDPTFLGGRPHPFVVRVTRENGNELTYTPTWYCHRVEVIARTNPAPVETVAEIVQLLEPVSSDTVTDSDEITCECGNVEHRDDTYEVEGFDNRLCSDCTVVCGDCEAPVHRDDSVSGDYCTDCRTLCASCDDPTMIEEMVSDRSGDLYCTDCRVSCPDCGTVFDPDDAGYVSYYRDEQYCTDCSYYCERCDEWRGSYCDECPGGAIRNLRGYGHTNPSQWLGGPLPKRHGHIDGYYLGFELEISASEGDASVLNDWGAKALGKYEVFECKEDSSVEGFEIASQPMTRDYIEKEFAPVVSGFFATLEGEFGSPYDDEPSGHGLHVHISRTAFRDRKGINSPAMLAAFCRILTSNNGTELERIGRRGATGYCERIEKPVSAALLNACPGWSERRTKRIRKAGETAYRTLVDERGWEYRDHARRGDEQDNTRWEAERRAGQGVYLQRGAINLHNSSTVEVRAFKSTRKPENLLAALRLVSDAADYVRYLAHNGHNLSAKNTSWSEFCRWVAANDPDMFEIVTGLRTLT